MTASLLMNSSPILLVRIIKHDPDFLSIASNMFEPGKFVSRAVDVAREYIKAYGGIGDALPSQTALDTRGSRPSSATPGPF